MLSKLLIEKTKPQAKSVRLSDGRGMYLEISPTGGKWWRFKYRFAGKERRISLGVPKDAGADEWRSYAAKTAEGGGSLGTLGGALGDKLKAALEKKKK